MKRNLCFLASILTCLLADDVAAQTTAIVTGDRVNVRGRPTIFSERITQLNKGDTVTILEEVTLKKPKANEPARWAKIQMPPGTPLWVYARYVDPTNKTVTVNMLNVRAGEASGSGENYSVVGVLSRGTQVKEIRVEGDWMEIDTPTNAFGFVAAEYLETKTEPPPPPPSEPAKTEHMAPAEAPKEAAPPPSEPVKTEPPAETKPVAEPEQVKSEPVVESKPITEPKPAEPPPAMTPAEKPAETAPAEKPAETTPAEKPAETTPPPPPPPPKEQPAVQEPPAQQPPAQAPKETPPPPEEKPAEVQPVKEETPSIVEPQPTPEPPPPPPPGKRIVRREGIVKPTTSIQAPTSFQLVSSETGKPMNYLHPTSPEQKLKPLKGRRVVVSGEELIDPRWPKTPVIDIETIELAP